jgi:hypothetical protein
MDSIKSTHISKNDNFFDSFFVPKSLFILRFFSFHSSNGRLLRLKLFHTYKTLSYKVFTCYIIKYSYLQRFFHIPLLGRRFPTFTVPFNPCFITSIQKNSINDLYTTVRSQLSLFIAVTIV